MKEKAFVQLAEKRKEKEKKLKNKKKKTSIYFAESRNKKIMVKEEKPIK